MAIKPGERRLQILQMLAAMLETPRGEKIMSNIVEMNGIEPSAS